MNRLEKRKIGVTGAAGFIAGHLISRLVREGHYVVGFDISEFRYGNPGCHRFEQTNLEYRDASIFEGLDEVYHLAADMGGMTYVSQYPAQIASNNMRIDLNVLESVHLRGVQKILFTSSACVYDTQKESSTTNVVALREFQDSWPANPEPGYGWAKLTTEKMLEWYFQQYAIQGKVVRFHNIYGPKCRWTGGRENVVPAMCRKIANCEVNDLSSIEIFGSGDQMRTFTYVDDAVEGMIRLMNSPYLGPINVGSEEMVSINELVRTVASVAGRPVEIEHVQGPIGVLGRRPDNTLIRRTLGWEPKISLRSGLERTYPWILEQVKVGQVKISDR